MDIWLWLLSIGVPSAAVTFCFWQFQKKLEKREAKREAKREETEKARQKKRGASNPRYGGGYCFRGSNGDSSA